MYIVSIVKISYRFSINFNPKNIQGNSKKKIKKENFRKFEEISERFLGIMAENFSFSCTKMQRTFPVRLRVGQLLGNFEIKCLMSKQFKKLCQEVWKILDKYSLKFTKFQKKC